MSIRRGFFRLWVVLSVLWVLVVCTGTYLAWPEDWSPFLKADDSLKFTQIPNGPTFNAQEFEAFKVAEAKRDLLKNAALLSIVLPAGVLALCSALFWAVRGFGK